MRGALWWLQLAAPGEFSVRRGGEPRRSLAYSEPRRGAESVRPGCWTCEDRVPERRELYKEREVRDVQQAPWSADWVVGQCRGVRELQGKVRMRGLGGLGSSTSTELGAKPAPTNKTEKPQNSWGTG